MKRLITVIMMAFSLCVFADDNPTEKTVKFKAQSSNGIDSSFILISNVPIGAPTCPKATWVKFDPDPNILCFNIDGEIQCTKAGVRTSFIQAQALAASLNKNEVQAVGRCVNDGIFLAERFLIFSDIPAN